MRTLPHLSSLFPVSTSCEGTLAPVPHMPNDPSISHLRKPTPLSPAQKIALLERQRAESLTNRAIADIAGVHEETVSQWRKKHGYAGRRGRPPVLSQEDKTALFVLKEEENLTDRALADLIGVTSHTISIWRTAMKRATTPAARRRLVMERSDGTTLRIEITEDELTRLLGLEPCG